MTTLRSLMQEHPEWADLPIVVYKPDGTHDYVGGAGNVYEFDPKKEGCEGVDGCERVLVFAAN